MFSHPESRSKISNLMITELFYSHILNIHLRSFRRIHLSVCRCRSTKNGLVGPKSFRGFGETGPWGEQVAKGEKWGRGEKKKEEKGNQAIELRYLMAATVRSVVSLGYGLAGMNSSSVTRSTRNSWNTWSSFESTRYCKQNQTNKNHLSLARTRFH